MRRRTLAFAAALAFAGALPLPTEAQRPMAPAPAAADTVGAFLDTGAAALLHQARAARLTTDRSLRSYTAIVRSRFAAGLRMPLKDRTLVRSESAARVRWSRDGENLVQVLAGRTQSPLGVRADSDGGGARPFDPHHDRLYFGMMRDSVRDGRSPSVSDDDDFYIEHPLAEHGERHYRYQSGDTITIRLQDGRVLRVAELLVIPRRNDPHTVRGTLWVETGSGAVVRAAFRLARKVDLVHDTNAMDDEDMAVIARMPLVHPMEFDLSLLMIEYALWDMSHWLPRVMRVEGMARAGVFVAPAAFEVSYDMLEVITDRDAIAATEAELIAETLAEWRAEGDYRVSTRGSRQNRSRVLRPRDPAILLDSELLPPPIWTDAPGFATEAELRRIYDRLASIAGPAHPQLPVRFGWGPGEPGMLRYNRVEALSVGARLSVPLPHVTLEAVGRIGAGDLHPNAELLLRRETLRRTLELSGYHRLTTADESRNALGAGNSLSAFVLGRDEGEYFRATGASLTLAPPAFRRRSWDARLYAESHHAVERGTHVSLRRLWNDSIFRDNIAAYETTQLGTALHFRPWWGTDPLGPQFGIDALLHGELVAFPGVGDRAWYEPPRDHVVRGRVTLRGAVPLPGRLRVGGEAAVGAARGSLEHAELDAVPPQRQFYVGGASTLRGYEPGTLHGPEMARGRFELARAFPFGNLAVFTDYARTSSPRLGTNELWAGGAGVSLLDGMMRIDLARGFGAARGPQAQAARRTWRLDLHLDAVL